MGATWLACHGCGVSVSEGDEHCPRCGREIEYDLMCPNCDEKLDDPDSCDFCRWESGDPPNDSDHLGEDEIPEASRGAGGPGAPSLPGRPGGHGATANHDQGLLDLLTRALGTGRYASITNLAVSQKDFAGEALRKQRRKVAALIRSHVKKLVDDGLLPPGHKVTIDWHYETGVPMAGLDPPYRTTHPRASQLHYQHEAAAKAEKEREQAAAKAEREQAAAKAEKEKAAKKAAKVKRQKKRVERVGKKRGCLPIVIGVFSIFGVFSVILDACEGDENTAWPEGFDQRVAEVSFED